MNKTVIFLVVATMLFLVWYAPKARAAQRLNYRPLFPNSVRVINGAIEWVQPIAVTNALNGSISIQNADIRAKSEKGYEYAQCILPNAVTVQPNQTTQMNLIIQIPLTSAPAIINSMIADAKADGIVSIVFDGVIKAEWFWFSVPQFKLDLPVAFINNIKNLF